MAEFVKLSPSELAALHEQNPYLVPCFRYLGENRELPDLSGGAVAAGKVKLAPMTCTFLVV